MSRIPLSVEDKTELKPGMPSLTNPRINKDADIFSSHSENGLGKGGCRDEHCAPLVRLAFLLRGLDGQRELLVEHLDEQLLSDA